MNRTQIAALLAAVGVGFTGGATFKAATGGAPASVTFIHALRIEATQLSDGGLGNDAIIAYRTRATVDAGSEDLSFTSCTGDTKSVRTWANCLFRDGGSVQNVRVIEVRPAAVGDGGSVAVEVYGDVAAKCTLPKPGSFKGFLDGLKCDEVKHRSKASPL